MKIHNSFQHDALVQSLYSGRTHSKYAPFFTYALAQARADVFFSLLFGSRIVGSAGAFFDSPIAIRVFGELLAHPDYDSPSFARFRKNRCWMPLTLIADNPKDTEDPRQYVGERFLNQNLKLGLFRESDDSMDEEISKNTAASKRSAAMHIANNDATRLEAVYEPYATYSYFISEMGFSELGTEIAPILTSDFAKWLLSIIQELEENKSFRRIDAEAFGLGIARFSPFEAIKRRTELLNPYSQINGEREDANQDSLNFQIDELREMNKEMSQSPMMNAFHVKGSAIYGHYLPLVTHWVETDWHTSRHAAYASATCLLSSTFEHRTVFDFDYRGKVNYLLEHAHIDDSLRQTQEGFADIDWSLLFAVISDPTWERYIVQCKEADTEEEKHTAGQAILALLSEKMSDFNVTAERGFVTLSAKAIVKNVIGSAAANLMVPSLHTSSHGFLCSLGRGAAISSVVEPLLSKVLVAGARAVYRPFAKRHLRKGIVPKIYLPES